MKRGHTAICLCLCLACLTHIHALPLEERVLEADGDKAVVPFTQWLQEVSGRQYGIVLHDTAWNDFSLPRSWKKGQTVRDAVSTAQLFSGRFLVEWSDDAVTLVPVTKREKLPRIDTRPVRKRIFSAGDFVFSAGIQSSGYTPKLAQSLYSEAATGYPVSSGVSGVGDWSFFDYLGVFISDSVSVGFLVRSSSYHAEMKSGTTEGSPTIHADASPMLLMLTGSWHLAPADWIDIGLGLCFGGIPPYGGENSEMIARELAQGPTFSYTMRDLSHWAITGLRVAVTLRVYRDLLVTLDWLNTFYLDTLRFEGFVNSVGISGTIRLELW